MGLEKRRGSQSGQDGYDVGGVADLSLLIDLGDLVQRCKRGEKNTSPDKAIEIAGPGFWDSDEVQLEVRF